MTQQRWHPLFALTGVVFVVLAVLAFIISGETPDTNDTPQKILNFYNDNDTEQIWASALLGWATVFFLFFLGVLRSTLRAAEGTLARLSPVALAGGAVLAMGMLSFAGFTFALADAADHLTPDAAQALNTLNSDFFFPVAVGLGTLLLATGITAVRSRILPVWLGWISILLGIAAVTPLGFFVFLVFGLWVLVVSVLLWRAMSAEPVGQP